MASLATLLSASGSPPPVQSVVFKTPSPTPAQTTQIRTVKAAAIPNSWSASDDPIIGAGPAGTGLHMTRSGRYVNSAGFYAGGVTPRTQAAAAQNQSGPTPVKTNARGFVASPLGGLKGGGRPSVKVAPVKVTVHPNGKIEVHATHTAPALAASAAPAGASVLAPTSSGRGSAPQTYAMTTGGEKVIPATVPVTAPLTVEQQAQRELNQIRPEILGPINARIAAQQAAINSSAQTLADLMGKYAPDAKAIYGNAQVGQAAVDSALGSTLSGQGQAGQDELAAKLQAIGADPGTVARLTSTAAANTTGATGALDARGSSSLSDLISQGTSAQDYGSKLPGVAGMYGLQSTKAAQAQGTTDIANAVAALEAKYPDIVNQIQTNRNQQAQINFERGVQLLNQTGVMTPEIRKLLGGGAPVGTPTLAKTKADAAAAAAAKNAGIAAGTVDLPLSVRLGYFVNKQGQMIGSKPIPVPPAAPKQSAPLSRHEILQQHAQAATIAYGAFNGVDGKGNPAPKLTWGNAMEEMRKAGIKADIARAELATWPFPGAPTKKK